MLVFGLQNIGFANCDCVNSKIFEPTIINNALNLTDEQIELETSDCRAFKKCLTYNQRLKYKLINKLRKRDCKDKKKQQNYYKSNPQMIPFGNPQVCP